jgi:hypothetical protein
MYDCRVLLEHVVRHQAYAQVVTILRMPQFLSCNMQLCDQVPDGNIAKLVTLLLTTRTNKTETPSLSYH